MNLSVRLAAEESGALAKSRQEADAKVKARIESGGRKPSYSDLSKGQAERPRGGVFSWQHWDPIDHENP
jgi:hypothetical protein